MCVFGNGASASSPAAIAPEPTRAGVTAKSATDVASNIAKAKKTATRRLGIFGNVATTPMGDASYGQSIATFGGAA